MNIVVMLYEPSGVVSEGIKHIISQATSKIEIIEVSRIKKIYASGAEATPHLIVADTSMFRSEEDIAKLRQKHPEAYIIGLQTAMDISQIANFLDDTISIIEPLKVVNSKIKDIIKQVKHRVGNDSEDSKESMTRMERIMLREITRGLSVKEIAQKLGLSINTVNTHKRNISNKLQIHTNAGLAIYAISNKLVDLEE